MGSRFKVSIGETLGVVPPSKAPEITFGRRLDVVETKPARGSAPVISGRHLFPEGIVPLGRVTGPLAKAAELAFARFPRTTAGVLVQGVWVVAPWADAGLASSNDTRCAAIGRTTLGPAKSPAMLAAEKAAVLASKEAAQADLSARLQLVLKATTGNPRSPVAVKTGIASVAAKAEARDRARGMALKTWAYGPTQAKLTECLNKARLLAITATREISRRLVVVGQELTRLLKNMGVETGIVKAIVRTQGLALS